MRFPAAVPRTIAALSRGIAKRCVQLGRNNEGGSLVEFAVTLPLILLLMTGIFSFSFALCQKIILSEAMSVGGRLLAVDRGDIDPCDTVSKAIYKAAPSLTKSSLDAYVHDQRRQLWNRCCNVSRIRGGKNTDMVQGQNATIQASFPVSITVYGTSFSNMGLGDNITEVIQ